MIAGVKCDIKDGWKLDEPHVSTIDADTYVLSYKGTFDGTCTMDGKTEKAPSPIRAATVWVRSGDKWLAAFPNDFHPVVNAWWPLGLLHLSDDFLTDSFLATHATRGSAPSFSVCSRG